MRASVYRVGPDRLLREVSEWGTLRAARTEAVRRNQTRELGLYVAGPARMDGYAASLLSDFPERNGEEAVGGMEFAP